MPSMTDGRPTYPPEWDKELDDAEDGFYDPDNLADIDRDIREELERE